MARTRSKHALLFVIIVIIVIISGYRVTAIRVFDLVQLWNQISEIFRYRIVFRVRRMVNVVTATASVGTSRLQYDNLLVAILSAAEMN